MLTSTPINVSKDFPICLVSASNKITPHFDLSRSEERVRSSGGDIRALHYSRSLEDKGCTQINHELESKLTGNLALCAANLASQNHLIPYPKPINGAAIKGYQPFLNKAIDVPNLMDYEDSTIICSSNCVTPVQEYHDVQSRKISPQRRKSDVDSDIFDRLSSFTATTILQRTESQSDVFDCLSNVLPMISKYEEIPSIKINETNKVGRKRNDPCSFGASQNVIKCTVKAHSLENNITYMNNSELLQKKGLKKHLQKDDCISPNASMKKMNIVTPVLKSLETKKTKG